MRMTVGILCTARKRLAAPHRHAAELAVLFLLLDRRPLVVLLLAPRHAELHLRPAVLEVDGQRDQARPALLRLIGELVDLALVHEQDPIARRLVVVDDGGLLVRVDVGVVQDQLALLDASERLMKLSLSVAQRLDLTADEDDPALDLRFDEVVVQRPPVRDTRGEIGGFAGHNRDDTHGGAHRHARTMLPGPANRTILDTFCVVPNMTRPAAAVAELADAQGSGPCDRKIVQVQFLSAALSPFVIEEPAIDSTRGAAHAPPSASCDANGAKEFAEVDGLPQDGFRLQAVNGRETRGVADGRGHDDPDRQVRFADAGEDLDAVAVGEHQVDDDRGGVRAEQVQPLFERPADHDFAPVHREQDAQRVGADRIVLDQQHVTLARRRGRLAAWRGTVVFVARRLRRGREQTRRYAARGLGRSGDARTGARAGPWPQTRAQTPFDGRAHARITV